MRLLIVTQAADRTDPVLGFFHGWLREFGRAATRVEVIAQRTGRTDGLPDSVRVHSLGKESGTGRITQVLRFWKLAWTLRTDYDAVLVHMTPIWVVLGAPVWLLARKPVFLWYEARGGGWVLPVALRCVRKVFSASARGMPVKTAKSVIVGHGIDTDLFSPGSGTGTDERTSGDLVTVGRITRAKRLGILIDCLAGLPPCTRLLIAGLPLTDDDRRHAAELQGTLRRRSLAHRVEMRPVSQDALVPILRKAGLFLHASETALDKALLEAMACGCPVLSCAAVAKDLLPPACTASAATMAERASALLALSPAERQALGRELRTIVVERHGLSRLVSRLVEEMA